MSPSIAFLVTPPTHEDGPHNDNHERLPRLFSDAGWQVHVTAHDDLMVVDDEVHLGARAAKHVDAIWPVGFGPQQGFLDRAQLLGLVSQAQLINPVQSYFTLHGKSAWLHYAPTTVVASDAVILVERLTHYGGDWVLKPVAGSFGENVHLVHTTQDIQQVVAAAPKRYWMLQRFIPEITAGETRTLICGDAVIGSYLRMPNPAAKGEFRTNLAVQGSPETTQLSAKMKNLVNAVHAELRAAGVRFAAIDTVGDYLMEVNLANPGGFGTLCDLYGEDFEQQAGQSIVNEVAQAIAET